MAWVGVTPLACAGLHGIKAIVALQSCWEGLSRPALGVSSCSKGRRDHSLVVIGLGKAIMAAVPLAAGKRSIGVGIGLFILFIGFVNGGLNRHSAGAVRRSLRCPFPDPDG